MFIENINRLDESGEEMEDESDGLTDDMNENYDEEDEYCVRNIGNKTAELVVVSTLHLEISFFPKNALFTNDFHES